MFPIIGMTNFDKVAEFHTAFNQPCNTSVNQELLHDFKMVSLRVKLIDEEFKELCQSKTMVEQLDAIGDLLYVVYGAGVCFGFDLNKEYTNYCVSMSNAGGIQCVVDYFNGKSNFEKSRDVYYVVDNPLKGKDITLEPKYIMNSNFINFAIQIKRLSYHLLMTDADAVCHSLIKMLSSIYITCIMCKYNIDEIFDIIHKSNMTKLCVSEFDAENTIAWYLTHEFERYKEPMYEKSKNGYYIIYDNATGKRLKSSNFTPPNIDVNKLYNINI